MKILVILSLFLYSIFSFGQKLFKKITRRINFAEPGSVIHLSEGNFTSIIALSLMTDDAFDKG